MSALRLLALSHLLLVGLHARGDELRPGADLIVFNAKITTQHLAQPAASAVAIKRGRIYAVGDDAEILALKNSKTKLIDAEGHRLIPGINDAHVHVLNENNYNYNVRWDGVPTLSRALEMLKEQAKRTPKGQWVKVIGGWSPYQFKENRFPTLEELNAAVPDRPYIVQYAYNQAFLNELAMKEIGVGTPKFQMPPGTEFEKDMQGKYTGVVRGFTWTFVALEAVVPLPSFAEKVNSLAYAINDLNRFGVVSALESGSIIPYPEGHKPIEALIRDQRLNVRFPFMDLQLVEPGASMVDAEIDAITKKSPTSPGDNTHPTLAHGHEYQTNGEVLNAQLHDHENFDRPAVVIDREFMRKTVEEDVGKLVKRRSPFRMHISYDENISPFLDALEALNKKTPFDGLRWSIEHAETISPKNIERIKKLGGGIALDDKMALHGDGFIKTHGREVALQTPRLRQLVDSGIPLAMTTDGFRASSYNPWVAIHWMVTGKSVSGSEILAKDNRLSREEALKLYTLGAAWFTKTENESGRIAPGNLADFALLSTDYFSVPEEEIQHITSVMTVVDGKVVFGAGKYSKLAPELPKIIPTWSPIKYFGGYYGAK
ncbi:amidohydrolase [Corallococcus sp. ZKHCc1 1396]|uniref:Amidohydrolase n=1 Tax=Corallococcus soli TaxID=2710757 RepID=A0ABR9PFR3_9BACT|nr:amidohydrolase [Corallococcus soli]MBE4746751.1 amidohydrolase [Corallococcus soli]